MSDDQFTKLFKYMEKQFGTIHYQFEENKKDHLDIRDALTSLTNQVKDYHQELIMLRSQDSWTSQNTEKTSIKLTYN